MINHLSGKLVEKNPAYIILECNGVGYFINISLHTYSNLQENEHLKIYTHLQINEDAHTLYGFAAEDERKVFRNLIKVSGIGPNTARMILSSLSPAEVLDCLASENVVRLKSIKGIGEKTAQRMILELKNKVLKEELVPPAGSGNIRLKEDAQNALLTLGFSKQSIDKTLDQLLKKETPSSVEVLIREALKTL